MNLCQHLDHQPGTASHIKQHFRQRSDLQCAASDRQSSAAHQHVAVCSSVTAGSVTSGRSGQRAFIDIPKRLVVSGCMPPCTAAQPCIVSSVADTLVVLLLISFVDQPPWRPCIDSKVPCNELAFGACIHACPPQPCLQLALASTTIAECLKLLQERGMVLKHPR